MTPPSAIEFLARGVLTHVEHILLCRSVEGGYCYLPGGHVEPGESSAEACAREFFEECGLRVDVGACLLVNELRFIQMGVERHEITTVFHVEHPSLSSHTDDTPPPLEQREEHIEMVWTPMAALVDLDLRPSCMRAWLTSGGVVTGTGTSGASVTEWLSVDER